MKILYIAQTSNSRTCSASKKIYSQCKALIQLGNICKCISIFRNEGRLYHFNEDEEFFKDVVLQESLWSKISRWFKLFFSSISEETVQIILDYEPDVIYIRNISPLLPSYISFIKRIKGKAKVFWELPTYPYFKEYFQPFKIASLIHMLFDFRSIERLRKVVDEFVVVNEIIGKEAERLGVHRVIPNGFDVSSVPVRKPPELNSEIHILGLANLASWHGYDRIIDGISKYKGSKRIVFHLAPGSGKFELEKLKSLAMQLGVSESVIPYPPLYGKELTGLFDKCHIAAGSLGMHRIQLYKGSILKLREYCSRGIPFFIAYKDEDFKNFSFCATFEPSEEPIDMNQVCSFIETVYETEDYPQIMRKYAEANLDWEVKMSKLFE